MIATRERENAASEAVFFFFFFFFLLFFFFFVFFFTANLKRSSDVAQASKAREITTTNRQHKPNLA